MLLLAALFALSLLLDTLLIIAAVLIHANRLLLRLLFYRTFLDTTVVLILCLLVLTPSAAAISLAVSIRRHKHRSRPDRKDRCRHAFFI